MRFCAYLLLVLAPVAVFMMPLYPPVWNETVSRAATRLAIRVLQSTSKTILDIECALRARERTDAPYDLDWTAESNDASEWSNGDDCCLGRYDTDSIDADKCNEDRLYTIGCMENSSGEEVACLDHSSGNGRADTAFGNVSNSINEHNDSPRRAED